MSRRNLPLLLLDVREAAMAHFRPILHRFQLTDQQWRVLRELAAAPKHALEPGQIGRACTILGPSLTGILNRLEQLRLVSRSGSEIDQRRQIIQLAPAGQKVVAEVLPLIQEQYRLIEEALGKRVLDDLYESLENALRLLSAPMASALETRQPREARARSR